MAANDALSFSISQSGNVDDGSITIRVMQQQTPNEQCQLNLFSLNVCVCFQVFFYVNV